MRRSPRPGPRQGCNSDGSFTPFSADRATCDGTWRSVTVNATHVCQAVSSVEPRHRVRARSGYRSSKLAGDSAVIATAHSGLPPRTPPRMGCRPHCFNPSLPTRHAAGSSLHRREGTPHPGKPICKRDAAAPAEMREMQATADDHLSDACRGQVLQRRLAETPETAA